MTQKPMPGFPAPRQAPQAANNHPVEADVAALPVPGVRALRTCGGCDHALFIDAKNIECYGAPPTPVLIGAGKDMVGRAQLQCELLRPRLKKEARACGLWRARPARTIDEVDLGAVADMKIAGQG